MQDFIKNIRSIWQNKQLDFNKKLQSIKEKILLATPEEMDHLKSCYDTPLDEFLTMAVKLKDPELVKFFLENGADAKFKESGNIPIIVIAVNKGNIETVQVLLKNGADINELTGFGSSALHEALVKKDEKMLKFLIKNQVKIPQNKFKEVTKLLFGEHENNDFQNIHDVIKTFYMLGLKSHSPISKLPSDIKKVITDFYAEETMDTQGISAQELYEITKILGKLSTPEEI